MSIRRPARPEHTGLRCSYRRDGQHRKNHTEMYEGATSVDEPVEPLGEHIAGDSEALSDTSGKRRS